MKYLINIIIALILLSCTGSSKSAEYQATEFQITVNDDYNTKSDSIVCNHLDSVYFTKIKYANDTIYVCKNADTVFKTQYVFSEKVLPFYGLITREDTVSRCYYIYQKKYLFIPLNEINNRWNIIVLNLQTKQEVSAQNGNMISTSVNWFYLDVKTGLLVSSNSINYDGKTEIAYNKIVNEKMVVQKSKKVRLDNEICMDYWKFRRAVKYPRSP
jgi:hypothetical protein